MNMQYSEDIKSGKLLAISSDTSKQWCMSFYICKFYKLKKMLHNHVRAKHAIQAYSKCIRKPPQTAFEDS